jgi:hypothetical protein
VPSTILSYSIVADSAEATGLKWQTPASGGGMTLLSTTTLSGASTTISSIDQTYVQLFVMITGVNQSAQQRFRCAPNGTTDKSNTVGLGVQNSGGTGEIQTRLDDRIDFTLRNYINSGSTTNAFSLYIDNYNSTTNYKTFNFYGGYNQDGDTSFVPVLGSGSFEDNTAISSLVFSPGSGTFSAGTVKVYGVK